MAKFKKKKSQPTQGTNDSKKQDDEKSDKDIPETENSSKDIPETENSSKDIPETPASEPIISETEKSDKDRKLNKLFWLRVALAVIAGTSATFIFEDIEGEERRWASIAFMIVVFLGTIVVAKGMKMQLPSADRKKVVTQAIGSYVFLYLFMWIVSYTLVHSGNASSGINI